MQGSPSRPHNKKTWEIPLQFIAILTRREGFQPEDFARHSAAETRRATELYAEGVFRQINSRADGRGAILTIEAPDEDGARAAIASLPLVELNMLSVELYGLNAYRGFTATLSQ
ncbi:hypothetical protein L1787_09785 [Acuticoccus sp. M5D2P5]|uniref:hypothetical protein n=1 Tax=Acuticoccus kalidii TaxID=2910977 RepID=UPI001F2C7387|nr:hypothetical protein [Acuticoccus kalidii]MCF3933703.1 hypothetical protein [Acuticoccus kalidii]